MKNIVLRIALLAAVVALGVAPMAHAQIYLSDGTLSNFTGPIPITGYATLSNFTGGDATSPYTPTSASVASGLRVFNGTLTGNGLATFFSDNTTPNNWIKATFPSAVSTIVVFPNIDHLGSGYDGYQYAIAGSNDGTNWTMLFDATGVSNSGEPFTLSSANGTKPLFVNNVVTPGAGPGGTVGYEAFFDFGTAYKFYAFGASTVAFVQGNTDQELSAVATGPLAITLPLQGNGVTNSFVFFTSALHKVTYNVIYPVDFSVPANTTMTISPNVLAKVDCNSAINVFPVGDTPTCTTFDATTPANFSVVFDVACSLNGAPSTSAQCPQTTGFNPFIPGAIHSSEDISNILTYVTVDPTPSAPQMLTAHEGNNDWVAFGLGFQSDCCTRGSGGSNYNSLVVAADFPAGSAQTIPPYNFIGFASPVANQAPGVINSAKAGSSIPLKWQLFYPNTPAAQALGFNGGPVTNLNFAPNGYLAIFTTPLMGCGTTGTTDVNTIPIDTATNSGLINDGNGSYHFNWKSSSGAGVKAGQCVTVTVSTGDQIQHNADILFH